MAPGTGSLMARDTILVYRPGRCGVCDQRLADGGIREVQLAIIAPTEIVNVCCSICNECRPTPVTVAQTTASLLERILRWYRSTPSAWPPLRRLTRA
jgi:hypothetical protein